MLFFCFFAPASVDGYTEPLSRTKEEVCQEFDHFAAAVACDNNLLNLDFYFHSLMVPFQQFIVIINKLGDKYDA